MKPDYKRAAKRANEIIGSYSQPPENADPLAVLKKLHNVLILPYNVSENGSLCASNNCTDNQDAFTLVNRVESGLQYIIMYNSGMPDYQLRFALARELGHVVLQHDGSQPEHIWLDEAQCFAYHFICPAKLFMPKPKPVSFVPHMDNTLWSLKSVETFDNIDTLKKHVVATRNRINKFIGGNKPEYAPVDIKLISPCEYATVVGLKNGYKIVLDGRTEGYCGE